jgi:hypothetical protein
MLALYVTIWVALTMFVAGETSRTLSRQPRPPAWAWWTFSIGLVLALVHTILAFDQVHDWDHAGAVSATARQTAAVFGVAVGWGVYVNYVFYAVWLADAVWWRFSPELARRPAAVTWALRAFYLVIIVNAAVIFAAGSRRIVGLILVSWMVGGYVARAER